MDGATSLLVASIIESMMRTATPLLLAAIGETISERGGVLNIGLEGSIIAGAFFGIAAASAWGAPAGVASAIVGGMAAAAVVALFVVVGRANQIITGTAVTLLFLGLTGMLYRTLYGETGVALTAPTVGVWRIPVVSNLPVIGDALFAQPPTTYVALLLVPAAWWFLHRTHAGLALRAAGENPEAAAAAGVPVDRVRFAGIMVGGALGGLAGGSIVLAQVGTFAEGLSAGRGFIAIAIVVLGRWEPVGVALAALLFGAANALQFVFQALGRPLPYQLFLAFPYALTLVALAVGGRRARPPAWLARDLDR
jgi:general nucleoside transport system permease protein